MVKSVSAEEKEVKKEGETQGAHYTDVASHQLVFSLSF